MIEEVSRVPNRNSRTYYGKKYLKKYLKKDQSEFYKVIGPADLKGAQTAKQENMHTYRREI